jgi:hypothetical protein
MDIWRGKSMFKDTPMLQHEGIRLIDIIELSTAHAKRCGMEGQAVYCFVLGEAIVLLQKAGCDDATACSLGLAAASRYRDEHESDFMCGSRRWWLKGDERKL